MSFKAQVVAFKDINGVAYIKQTRDVIDSDWMLLTAYKTVTGYSYEQVLEWAFSTKATPIYGGEEFTLNLRCYEQYTGAV